MNLNLELKDIVQIAEAVAERINSRAGDPVRSQWLTRAEAAEHLRCSTKHLDGLVRLGEIPVYRPTGPTGRPLFLASELDDFVHQARREW